jgi:hypothetical protein
MADELAKAITKIIWPPLKAEGFQRCRKRDLIRVESGIVQRLYFQVSAWGSKDFCVTACANLVSVNEHVTLQPGFRLRRDPAGGDLWLPSKTNEEAERSAHYALEAIRAAALPYFETVRTLPGYSTLLAQERWGSAHHLSFERGATAAMQGDVASAQHHLADAVQLYKADGREWCAGYIERVTALQNALVAGTADELIGGWFKANSKAHGIR